MYSPHYVMLLQNVFRISKLHNVATEFGIVSPLPVCYVATETREASKLKNVTKSGKSPKGKGVSTKNQKVQNSKFGLFDKFQLHRK